MLFPFTNRFRKLKTNAGNQKARLTTPNPKHKIPHEIKTSKPNIAAKVKKAPLTLNLQNVSDFNNSPHKKSTAIS